MSEESTLSPLYRGRFAPSPTGTLHLGSLYTAVASYLRAKSVGGQWLLRIDDLDQSRIRPGCSDSILRDLEHLGLHWDDAVYYQSQQLHSYAHALNNLQPHTYRCGCTRSLIRNQSPQSAIYPGTCRKAQPGPNQEHAIRLRVPTRTIHFVDLIQGPYAQSLHQAVGDFIVRRRDHFFAYQLAVVIDDQQQGITEVVRGADLLDNTPRQIYLQELLHLKMLKYAHVPLLLDLNSNKLSKSTRPLEQPLNRPQQLVMQILQLLNQRVLSEWIEGDLHEIWRIAIQQFDFNKLPHYSIQV